MTQHPPSAARLQRAKARGDVAYSPPLTRALALAAAIGWASWLGEGWWTRWRAGVADALTGQGGDWAAWLQWAAWQGVALIGGMVAISALVGSVQARGGTRRHPTPEGWRQVAYRWAAHAALLWAVGDAVAAWTKAQPYGAAWEPWRALGWRIAAVALAVGAGDALLGRWLRWRRLHMTDAEARAARHEGEASPAMRQRLRQGASASPAPTQDPPAPTHIADPTDWRWAALTITDDAGQAAACLSYAPPLIDPPHLAKIAHGDAEVAALVEAAHARGVAVAQEPPILRALLAMAVRVGQPIPHALFEPVGRLMGACGVSGEDAPRA